MWFTCVEEEYSNHRKSLYTLVFTGNRIKEKFCTSNFENSANQKSKFWKFHTHTKKDSLLKSWRDWLFQFSQEQNWVTQFSVIAFFIYIGPHFSIQTNWSYECSEANEYVAYENSVCIHILQKHLCVHLLITSVKLYWQPPCRTTVDLYTSQNECFVTLVHFILINHISWKNGIQSKSLN